MSASQIEDLQGECFRRDYETLGPAVVRTVETWFAGWKRHHDSASAYLRAKAERWAEEIRVAWPVLAAARRYGPTREAVERLAAEIRDRLGAPSLFRRALSLAAPLAAAWTRFTLAFDWFQHPSLQRNEYRCKGFALPWGDMGKLRVEIDRAMRSTVLRIEGAMDNASAKRLAAAIREYLKGCDAQVQIVIAQGTEAKNRSLRLLAKKLKRHRHRLSIVLPSEPGIWSFLSRSFQVNPA